ncbi:MAG: HNH endonuclease [Rhodospirillales bacterium]|nr:HNH endonuclease [Rhodospirillales bacterium]
MPPRRGQGKQTQEKRQWGGACSLTRITHPRLLRASHMKPWADCATDGERLDVHNGMLLAAHLDAAFDAGLIAFTDGGALIVSPALSPPDRARLGLAAMPLLVGLKPAHLPYLAHHRTRVLQTPAA